VVVSLFFKAKPIDALDRSAFGLTCKFNHPEPAPPTVQYSAQQGSYVPVVRPMAPLPSQMLAVPQQYYYTYPSQGQVPAALYPVAPAPGVPQLGGISGLGPAPGLMFPQRSALSGMPAASPGGGLALRQPALQQGLQPLQGSPGSVDHLASGFGALRLQGGQQGLPRR
jgi:hypothetical protein